MRDDGKVVASDVQLHIAPASYDREVYFVSPNVKNNRRASVVNRSKALVDFSREEKLRIGLRKSLIVYNFHGRYYIMFA